MDRRPLDGERGHMYRTHARIMSSDLRGRRSRCLELGHRVVAARMEGMAAAESTCRQKPAPPKPVALKAAARVSRAARLESTARTQKRTDNHLIATDETDRHPPRRAHTRRPQPTRKGPPWLAHARAPSVTAELNLRAKRCTSSTMSRYVAPTAWRLATNTRRVPAAKRP